jgi:hypothetical protein
MFLRDEKTSERPPFLPPSLLPDLFLHLYQMQAQEGGEPWTCLHEGLQGLREGGRERGRDGGRKGGREGEHW